MAYAVSTPVTTDRGTYNSGTAYVSGDGVTFTGFDEITGQGIRFVAKRSTTGNAPTLAAGDLNWGPAHATTALQFFNTLLALLKSAAFMGAGQNWTELYRYDALGVSLTGTEWYYITGSTQVTNSIKRLGATLKAPGLSGTENIYLPMIFSEAINATATRNIRLNSLQTFVTPPGMAAGNKHTLRGDWVTGTAYAVGDVVVDSYWDAFPQYSFCTVAHTSDSTNKAYSGSSSSSFWVSTRTGNHEGPQGDGFCTYSQVNPIKAGYSKIWNGGTGDIPFWIFANGNRVIFATDSNGKKHVSHAGYFLNYGDPANYAYPVLIAGNDDNPNAAYDAATCHNYPLGVSGLVFYNTDTSDYPVYAGFAATNGFRWGTLQTKRDIETGIFRFKTYPFRHHGNDFFNTNEAGEYFLEEALLFAVYHPQNNECGFCGQIDGLYYIQPIGLSAGNYVTVSGVKYWLFDDVFRGNSGGFLALKEA